MGLKLGQEPTPSHSISECVRILNYLDIHKLFSIKPRKKELGGQALLRGENKILFSYVRGITLQQLLYHILPLKTTKQGTLRDFSRND